MDNVVDAVLDRLNIYRPGGEDLSAHKALDLLLGPDPTIGLHEPELQVGLDTLIKSVYVRLAAGARCNLEELDVNNAQRDRHDKEPTTRRRRSVRLRRIWEYQDLPGWI